MKKVISGYCRYWCGWKKNKKEEWLAEIITVKPLAI